MPVALAAFLLLAAPDRASVAVLDVSRPDAVYGDVARALAGDVVTALRRAGLDASLVEEDALPPEGCRAGPCLGRVARARGALALVLVDASERGEAVDVAVMALAAGDARPLSAQRYEAGTAAAGKALAKLAGELAKQLTRADAGR